MPCLTWQLGTRFGLFTVASASGGPVEPTIRRLELPHGEFRAGTVNGLGENKALDAKRPVSPRCCVPTWATGCAAPIHAESTGWTLDAARVLVTLRRRPSMETGRHV